MKKALVLPPIKNNGCRTDNPLPKIYNQLLKKYENRILIINSPTYSLKIK